MRGFFFLRTRLRTHASLVRIRGGSREAGAERWRWCGSKDDDLDQMISAQGEERERAVYWLGLAGCGPHGAVASRDESEQQRACSAAACAQRTGAAARS